MVRARRRARLLPTLAVGAALGAALAVVHLTGADALWLRRIETASFDLRLRLRGPVAPGPETVIVLIDEESIERIGRWPLPRRRHAELLEVLTAAGARVIALDLLFAEPDPTEDERLAAAMAAHGATALAFTFRFGGKGTSMPPFIARNAFVNLRSSTAVPRFALRPTGLLSPVPILGESAPALGHALVAFDADGAPRLEYPVVEHDLEYLPSLAVRIVQLYLGVPWSDVSADFGRAVTIGSASIPLDDLNRVPVNYRGPPQTFPTYSFASVLAGEVPPGTFNGRIVLVGTNILGVQDTFETPFSAVLPAVERLATIVDATLRGDHHRRPNVLIAIESAIIFAIVLALAGGVAILPISASTALAVLLAGATAVTAQLALSKANFWLHLAFPLVGQLVAFALLVIYRHGLLDREHRQVRAALSRYVAPAVVERLADNPAALRLGGELRDLSVLFCDIRGFTALAERLSPPQLTHVVNEVFTPLSDIVMFEQGGTIDKYIGDCLMAFWNAPLDEPEHALRACQAALAMQSAMGEINERLQRESPTLASIAVGIGINTGPCTVGNFGSRRQFNYSALGDAVNISWRLQDATKRYGTPIIIGPETAARTPRLAHLPIDLVRIKGRAAPIEIHALVGGVEFAESAAFIELKRMHLHFRAAYLERDWAAAEHVLGMLRRMPLPDLAPLYHQYAARVAALREDPPPLDWDGVLGDA